MHGHDFPPDSTGCAAYASTSVSVLDAVPWIKTFICGYDRTLVSRLFAERWARAALRRPCEYTHSRRSPRAGQATHCRLRCVAVSTTTFPDRAVSSKFEGITT